VRNDEVIEGVETKGHERKKLRPSPDIV